MLALCVSVFQFYDTQRIDELFAKRRDWWHRYQVALKENEGTKDKKKKEDGGEEEEEPAIVLDGKEIDENEGFSNEERGKICQKSQFYSVVIRKDFIRCVSLPEFLECVLGCLERVVFSERYKKNMGCLGW